MTKIANMGNRYFYLVFGNNHNIDLLRGHRMQRISALFAAAATVSSLALVGCFGDNNGGPNGTGSGEPDGPSIVEIVAPDEADVGDMLDLTVKVKGVANEQLSVAIDGMLGTFSPQAKVVIVDDNGEGTFATRYTAGSLPGTDSRGTEMIKVSAANLSGVSALKSKELAIYDIERVGNTVPFSSNVALTKQAIRVLIAYPMTIDRPRVVSKLGIIHPPQDILGLGDAQVGLYATSTATSVTAIIAKTSVKLVPGQNEILIPPASVPAGKVWMVVTFKDEPLVYRSTTLADVLFTTTYLVSDSLPDTISGLKASDTVANRIGDRNFYLVLRK
jgi:hypothetical protein